MVGFYGQRTNLAVLEAETGSTIWENTEDKSFRITASPAIGEDGIVYTVGGDTLVRAFAVETGLQKWEAPLARTRCMATPALAKGRLFVPTGDGTLHALDASTGREVWTWQSGEGKASYSPYVRGGMGAAASPVVVGETVYLGAADGCLYALDCATGRDTWHHEMSSPTMSSPAVSGSGLWTGTCDGYLHAFSGSR